MSEEASASGPGGVASAAGVGEAAGRAEEEVVLFENAIDLDLRKGVRKENPQLDHRCQLFDCPSLLFEKRWLGTDAVRIELMTATAAQAEAARRAFAAQFSKAGLQGTMSIENVADREHRNTPEGCSAVCVSDVKITQPVKPGPLLRLIGVALWVEPNKIRKMEPSSRYSVLQGARGTGDAAEATQRADAVRARIDEELQRLYDDQTAVLKSLKRLQSFTSMPAKQTKGADVFRYLQAKRVQLRALALCAECVSQIYFCKVCGCIVQVVGTRPTDQSILAKLKPPASTVAWPTIVESEAAAATTAADRKATTEKPRTLEQRIRELEIKVSEAKGKEVANRRKRLNRKLKALRAELEKEREQ